MPFLDRRPDRPGRPRAGPRPTGPEDLEVDLLPPAGVDDRHRPGLEPPPVGRPTLAARRGSGPPRRAAAASPTGRCGRTAAGLSGLEALQEQGEEDPALVAAEGVDLVDDHVRDARRISRARLVSIRWSDSGVVIRMSGGLRTIRCRSAAGVSPLRTATRERAQRHRPAPRPSPGSPRAGPGGCGEMSWFRAFSGEM